MADNESEYWFCPKCGFYGGELISELNCERCGTELVHSVDDYRTWLKCLDCGFSWYTESDEGQRCEYCGSYDFKIIDRAKSDSTRN